jgi:hypothetical protein
MLGVILIMSIIEKPLREARAFLFLKGYLGRTIERMVRVVATFFWDLPAGPHK